MAKHKVEPYVVEVKALIDKYGLPRVAALLETTERGVLYWLAEVPKMPRKETVRTIHELFTKDQEGVDLSVENESKPLYGANSDYRDKVIALLERENERLRKELEVSLNKIRRGLALARAISETNQGLLVELLAKKNKMTVGDLSVKAGKENDARFQGILKDSMIPAGDT